MAALSIIEWGMQGSGESEAAANYFNGHGDEMNEVTF
jgi:hypothetical protein